MCHGETGEREKRKRAGDDGEGKLERKCNLVPPQIDVPHVLAIISIMAILIVIPSGSLCGGERYKRQRSVGYITAQLLIMKFDSKTAPQYVLQLN